MSFDEAAEESSSAGLHYFACDIIVTLLSWSATAPPAASEAFLCGRVVAFIMKNTPHSSATVVRNRIAMVKAALELWRDNVAEHLPFSTLYSLLASEDSASILAGLHLLSVVVANEFMPYTPGETPENRQGLFRRLVGMLSARSRRLHRTAAVVLVGPWYPGAARGQEAVWLAKRQSFMSLGLEG